MPRPKQFEPEVALARAMEQFWRRGYEATSVQDLVEATGVNRASLYAEFGDKRSLFLKALARYGTTVVPGRLGILMDENASLPDIRSYFEAVASDLAGSARDRGCLMVNTAIEFARRDPEIARQVRRHHRRLEGAFETALERARLRGELRRGIEIAATARFLTTIAQGLMVTGKSEPDPARLHDVVECALASLVLPE